MRKLPHRLCLICNKETKRTTTKFCSIECRIKSQKGKRFGGPKLTVLPRPCLTCKLVFSPKGYKKKAKYCSQHCMGKARADFCSEMGKKMRGKKISKITRRKLSVAMSKRLGSMQRSRGRGGYRKDLGHYVRSRWEANFARYLKFVFGTYEYEPETILLESAEKFYCYTPDFKVGDTYYEVKGWWDWKSLLKKKLMQEQHPDIKIIYINTIEYTEIKLKYEKVIKNWEK